MTELYQYYTTLCANLLSIGYGMFLGWPSPILPLLQSESTPLSSGPITINEATTISSIMFVGNLTGTIVLGLIADKFGRKIAIYLTAVPLLIYWLLIILADNVFMIYIARLVGGFSGGGVYLVIPIYVTEISENNIRGRLGSLLQVIVNLGLLFAYICGAFLNYYWMAYIALAFPILFMIGFAFIPETPAYFIAKNRYEEAVESLKYFRGLKYNQKTVTEGVQTELNEMKINSEKKRLKYSDLTCKDFTNRAARRGITLSIVLLIMVQGSGSLVLLNYTSMLFEEAGSLFSPNVSSIIVAVLLFFGSVISPVFVERAGRKILLMLSTFFTGLCLAIMGVYVYLQHVGYDLSEYSWISVVMMSGAIFNMSWGIITLPYMIVTEILSIRIRSTVAMMARITMAIVGFTLLKCYFNLTDLLGLYGCLWMFALLCFGYIVFIAICLPETKGKSIDDIVKSLER